MSRLKGRHGRSPRDAGTILLDRMGSTDDFSRSGRDGGFMYLLWQTGKQGTGK